VLARTERRRQNGTCDVARDVACDVVRDVAGDVAGTAARVLSSDMACDMAFGMAREEVHDVARAVACAVACDVALVLGHRETSATGLDGGNPQTQIVLDPKAQMRTDLQAKTMDAQTQRQDATNVLDSSAPSQHGKSEGGDTPSTYAAVGILAHQVRSANKKRKLRSQDLSEKGAGSLAGEGSKSIMMLPGTLTALRVSFLKLASSTRRRSRKPGGESAGATILGRESGNTSSDPMDSTVLSGSGVPHSATPIKVSMEMLLNTLK
jgi:hypothetical protein